MSGRPTNDTTGSSAQILKRLDAIKKRYKDTLAARKTLAASPLMTNPSPMVSLTPLPEYDSAQVPQRHHHHYAPPSGGHSAHINGGGGGGDSDHGDNGGGNSGSAAVRPRGRVEELQASGLSPPPPLHMTFSPRLPPPQPLSHSAGPLPPSTAAATAAAAAETSPAVANTRGRSPYVRRRGSSGGGGDPGSAAPTTSSPSPSRNKQSYFFNAALLQLLKEFSLPNDAMQQRQQHRANGQALGQGGTAFPAELGTDSLSILRNLRDAIHASSARQVSLQREVAALKEALATQAGELKQARTGGGAVSAADVRSIVREELRQDRAALTKQLEGQLLGQLLEQQHRFEQHQDLQRQQHQHNVVAASLQQQFRPHLPSSEYQLPATGRSPPPLHPAATAAGTGGGTAAGHHHNYHHNRATPTSPDARRRLDSGSGGGGGNGTRGGDGDGNGDSAVRGWQDSLTVRRCVSLLQYVGWDDPARLAVLTDQQYRGVLAQVGMVPSETLTRANVLGALSAVRR